MKKTDENLAKRLMDIFLVSTRLGLTSFGGPVAHLGYFHEEYVRRKQWIDAKSYADLVALCQFLPGPASSQVGIGIGVVHGGILGGLISFIGFTLPSVILLIMFASLLDAFDIHDAGWIRGLKIVAVAVVAHAVMGMAKSLTPDIQRKAIALCALIATLVSPSPFTQVAVILGAGLLGWFIFRQKNVIEHTQASRFPVSKRTGYACLSLFVGLLILLPFLREWAALDWLALFDSFYRSGSLVFGGGHVVLPLLEREFVPAGWLSGEKFLAGYAAAQAVPGPLFTFAAYIGAVIHGWEGGLLGTVAIFLPAFLLILGVLPFWDALRGNRAISSALTGVNAAVVGILISALYHPIWTSSILSSSDFALAAILFSMLAYWKCPPWLVVLAGAAGGLLISTI